MLESSAHELQEAKEAPMLVTFYATVAQICFALLGLWWIVVQFKYAAWMHVSTRRRMAFNISHYFVLPGVMSLVALLAGDTKILWQIAFILAGILGAVETISIIFNADLSSFRPRAVRVGGWIQLVLYVFVVLFALNAAFGARIALPLEPLVFEGITIALLLLLGVNLAWTFFSAPEKEG
jgi:hypothetical protein